MNGKINWKNVFFSLEEEKTLEERILTQKIIMGIVIILIGLLLIFPVEKKMVKSFADEEDYTLYGSIMKIVMMIYPIYYYRKINKALSLAKNEFENPTVQPIQKSELIEKHPELGRNLGLKGFMYALVFLVFIILLLIFLALK
jgi:hypothetical protein